MRIKKLVKDIKISDETDDERQIIKRYKYGLHCYSLSIIILLIYCIVSETLGLQFENIYDLLLLILVIPAAYYIIRLIWSYSFFGAHNGVKYRYPILLCVVGFVFSIVISPSF